jgi:hypothetical protein
MTILSVNKKTVKYIRYIIYVFSIGENTNKQTSTNLRNKKQNDTNFQIKYL